MYTIQRSRKIRLAGVTLLVGLLILQATLSACNIGNRLNAVNHYDAWKNIRTITIVNDYVYAPSGRDGVLVFDVSDPQQPVKLDFNLPLESAFQVAIVDQYAYVVNSELYILDISAWTDPRLIGTYRLSTPPVEVVIQPPYAYLAAGAGDFHIIDISDPTTPVEMEIYRSGADVWDVAVEGNYAYIIVTAHSGEDIVEIVDVSQPARPRLVGTTPVSFASDIAVQNNYAFVVNGHGLQIIDLSNPFLPRVITSYDTPNNAEVVKIENNYAYIGDLYGVEVVDISNVDKPTRVGYYELEQVKDIAVVSDYIYVADSNDGLIIFERP